MSINKRPPIEVAADVLKEKYPAALCAFVAGSFNRGEETAYSDIDLVVIFERLENGWRESFTFDGWPVEAFVHDPETLAAFFASGAEGGIPDLANMVIEGPLVPAGHQLGLELKTAAAAIVAKNPPEWDSETIARKRYFITDLLDDLRDPKNALEAATIIGALHEELGDFYFRINNLWSARRKHIPRILAKTDPVLAAQWTKAFLGGWAGDTHSLIKFAEDLMARHGGLLFDGYRSDAPKDKRIIGP